MTDKFASAHDGPTCYICGCNFRPDYMLTHLKEEHTIPEVIFFLALHYVDEWKEANELEKGVLESIEA